MDKWSNRHITFMFKIFSCKTTRLIKILFYILYFFHKELFLSTTRFIEHYMTRCSSNWLYYILRADDYTGNVSDVTRSVKTLTFHPNSPDFVASTIRGIMRVCERAYVRVGSWLAPGIRGSLCTLSINILSSGVADGWLFLFV